MFCNHCGAEINDEAVVCVKCGCSVTPPRKNPADKSSKDWIVTGKVGTGILQLITLGACGVWTLVDFIMIALGNFTDADGKRILNDR